MRKYQTFIGFRFLRSRLLNFLAMGAVAVSVAVLVVVLCVMWGFDRDFRQRIRGALSTITIEGTLGDELDDWEEVAEEISGIDGVKAAAPYVQRMCLLKTPSYVTHALVKGVQLDREAQVGQIDTYFHQGGKKQLDFRFDDGKEPEYPGAVLGRELCEQLGIGPGTELELVIPRSLASFFRRPSTFVMVGQFYSGWYDYDSHQLYIGLDAAQALLGLGDAVTGVSVEVTDARRATEIRDAIRRKLGSICRVQTWEDQRRNFLQAVALERRVLAVILGMVAILSGFTILATTTMTVKEKTRDIGILKSCGGTMLGIMSIFVLNGLYIGLIGAGLGLAAALAFLARINPISRFVEHYTGFSVFPQSMYYIEEIPVDYNATGIAWIVVLAVVLSVAYAIYPAWRASRLNPVEALRYE